MNLHAKQWHVSVLVVFYNCHGDSCSEVPWVRFTASRLAVHLCGSSPLQSVHQPKPAPLAWASWSLRCGSIMVTEGNIRALLCVVLGEAQTCIDLLFSSEEIMP